MLSKNFSRKEFECKCGCGLCNPSPRLVQALQKLRDLIGRPITITSAHRCPKHNAKVGGVPNSQHVQGIAVDIQVKGMTPKEIAKCAETIKDFYAGGIGIYKTFVHLDVRTKQARWNG